MDRFDLDFYATPDRRTCPYHPHVITQSANGLVDGLCHECEALNDLDAMIAAFEATEAKDR